MAEQLLLGIDVGTSVVKSVLFDIYGKEVAVSRRVPDIIRLQAGWSEASMEALWQDVQETLHEVATSERAQGSEIVGIGLTGTCCSSWLLDDTGKPVRNAILWNDGRAAENRDGASHFRLPRNRASGRQRRRDGDRHPSAHPASECAGPLSCIRRIAPMARS